MTTAVDLSTLPGPAQKILDGSAPLPIRMMAAKGIAPGMRPVDALTVIVLLAESTDEVMAQTAQTTLGNLPAPLLNGALSGQIHPNVLDVIARKYAGTPAVMEKILQQPNILPDTVAHIAQVGNEPVCELIAVNEERLLANPVIVERLYMNPSTRMSTADRILELAVRNGLELPGIPAFKEAAAAIANELIVEPSVEPTPDDILYREVEQLGAKIAFDAAQEESHAVTDEGEEAVVEKLLPLHARLGSMSISQRIRLAMLGSASERALLVRDKNRLVCSAAVRSPKIQEPEIVLFAASRNVSDDVLRIIANNRVWTQNHQIKLNLVMNPRTPFTFSSRLVGFLREDELKKVGKSKMVAANVAQLARQTLDRRKKK